MPNPQTPVVNQGCGVDYPHVFSLDINHDALPSKCPNTRNMRKNIKMLL